MNEYSRVKPAKKTPEEKKSLKEAKEAQKALSLEQKQSKEAEKQALKVERAQEKESKLKEKQTRKLEALDSKETKERGKQASAVQQEDEYTKKINFKKRSDEEEEKEDEYTKKMNFKKRSNQEEEKELAIKPDQKEVTGEEEEEKETVDSSADDDEYTRRINRRRVVAFVEEEKKSGPTTITLSLLARDTFKLNKPINNQLQLLPDRKVLAKEFLKKIGEVRTEKLIALATKSQVVHLMEEKSLIDYEDPDQLVAYIEQKGKNFSEVYSLEKIGVGGQSLVFRADFKQPIEAVVKTVLPTNNSKDGMTAILQESHLIKVLENKEFTVEIYEEIIEFSPSQNDILNYVVVVEQALQDLLKITNIWNDPAKSTENMEFFSNHKLMYFLLKAAEALDYLHQEGIYYGDMKEANLLVFRDYQVKIGDFGVSFKFDTSKDPDEACYELSGGTSGYCLNQFERALKENAGDLFSRNELIKNDYFAFWKTFDNIRQAVASIKAFKSDQLFSIMLEEMAQLDTQQNTLSSLIQKYSFCLQDNHKFIYTLCEELSDEEKYFAIPNILKLSVHRLIPDVVQKYFRAEEERQMPWLKPGEKEMEEEKKNEEEKVDEKEIIKQKIQEYISQNPKEDFLPLIEYLSKYKGSLSPKFTNSFYPYIFSNQFIYVTKAGFQRDNANILLKHPQQVLGRYFAEDLNNNKRRKVLLYYFSLFLFHAQTCDQNGDLLEKVLDKALGYDEQKDVFNIPALTVKHLKKLYQIYLHYLRCRLASDLPIRSDYHTFEKFSQISSMIQLLQDLSNGLSTADYDQEVSQYNLQRTANSSVLQEHYLKLQPMIYKYQKERQLNNLLEGRKHLKRIYGEVGGSMSLIAFQIYQLRKELEAEGKPITDKDKNEGFILLQKACNYSSLEQQQEFLLDLIIEYKERGMEEKSCNTLELLKKLNIILHQIGMKFLRDEVLDAKDLSKEIYQHFWEEGAQNLLKKMLKQSSKFSNVVIKVFQLERARQYSSRYIWKEMQYKFITGMAMNKLSEQQKQREICYSIPKHKFKLTCFESNRQLLEASFSNDFQVSIELYNFVRNGQLKDESETGYVTEEFYKNGGVSGFCRYKTPSLQMEGESQGGKFKEAAIKYYNGQTYMGECRFFQRHGKGALEKCFFFSTAIREVGKWENGKVISSKLEVAHNKEFLQLIIATAEGTLAVLEETDLQETVKQHVADQLTKLIIKVESLNDQQIFPVLLILSQLQQSLKELCQVFFALFSSKRDLCKRITYEKGIFDYLTKSFEKFDVVGGLLEKELLKMTNKSILDVLKEELDISKKVLELTKKTKGAKGLSLELKETEWIQSLPAEEIKEALKQIDELKSSKQKKKSEPTLAKIKRESKRRLDMTCKANVQRCLVEARRNMDFIKQLKNKDALEFFKTFYFCEKKKRGHDSYQMFHYFRIFIKMKLGCSYSIAQTAKNLKEFEQRADPRRNSLVSLQELEAFFNKNVDLQQKKVTGFKMANVDEEENLLAAIKEEKSTLGGFLVVICESLGNKVEAEFEMEEGEVRSFGSSQNCDFQFQAALEQQFIVQKKEGELYLRDFSRKEDPTRIRCEKNKLYRLYAGDVINIGLDIIVTEASQEEPILIERNATLENNKTYYNLRWNPNQTLSEPISAVPKCLLTYYKENQKDIELQKDQEVTIGSSSLNLIGNCEKQATIRYVKELGWVLESFCNKHPSYIQIKKQCQMVDEDDFSDPILIGEKMIVETKTSNFELVKKVIH